MLQIGVLGASGYAGGEIIRLLSLHPQVCLSYLTSDTYAGQYISRAHPNLRGMELPACETLDIETAAEKADILFLAQHNGWAMNIAPKLVELGKKVIDLGADFRFRDTEVYQKWYKCSHVSSDAAQKAVYGLPELKAKKIATASLVGNPGCYPTSAILALAPLIANRLIDPSTIIIDSKSGASGAGRSKFELQYLFSEIDNSLKPYSIGTHRHTPEIEQELSEIAGEAVKISFTPHLVPMVRGILTTAYSSLAEDQDTDTLLDLYRSFYAKSPFVFILNEGEYPTTKATLGSNFCHIGLKVDRRTRRVVVVSAIDNLIKGAAGQAIQNMNIMCGLDERTGLNFAGLYP